MDYQFNMPTENEQQSEEKREIVPSIKLFKPSPNIIGEKYTNELFIPLYFPGKWGIFNLSAEKREELGLVDYNPIGNDLCTFYFRVSLHTIQQFVRKDGSVGFAQVLCPAKTNKYLTEVLKREPLFKSDRCPHCEAERKAWDSYNERWREIEREKGIKQKDLSKEGKREIATKDPILTKFYTQARGFGSGDRYVLCVMDYEKITEVKKLEENEILGYQPYLAPLGVFNSLRDFWVEDTKDKMPMFFSLDNPEGLQIIKVIKSTENCRDDNFRDTKYRDTKYSVMKGRRVKLDEEAMQYLSNPDSMADPSPWLMILSQREMEIYSSLSNLNKDKPEESVEKVDQEVKRTFGQAPKLSTAPLVPSVQPPKVSAPSVPKMPIETPVSSSVANKEEVESNPFEEEDLPNREETQGSPPPGRRFKWPS